MFSEFIKLNNKYSDDINKINNIILKFLNNFNETINKDIILSGKRIRSIFALDIFYKYSANSNNLLKALALIELIHFASLLHDDVVDQSKTRRNSMSLFASSGAKTSILLGDYILSYIFNLATDLPNLVFKKFLTACQNTAYGAYLELNLNNQSALSDYINVARLKTSSLFRLAEFCAKYYAKQEDKNSIQNLENIIINYIYEKNINNININGDIFGIIFQIQNDLNAYKTKNWQDNEDYENGTYTFPRIFLNNTKPEYNLLFINKSQKNYEQVVSIIKKFIN